MCRCTYIVLWQAPKCWLFHTTGALSVLTAEETKYTFISAYPEIKLQSVLDTDIAVREISIRALTQILSSFKSQKHMLHSSFVCDCLIKNIWTWFKKSGRDLYVNEPGLPHFVWVMSHSCRYILRFIHTILSTLQWVHSRGLVRWKRALWCKRALVPRKNPARYNNSALNPAFSTQTY